MQQLDSKPPLSLYTVESPADWAMLKSEISLGGSIHQAVDNLLNYAHTELRATRVVVENGYICKDFRDEYSYLYSRFFQRIDDRCDRLHFLSGDVADIAGLSRVSNEDYRGFSVIRPLPVQRIGRTVFGLPECHAFRDVHYPLCSAVFPVHLGPATFHVRGVPFIQQDGMVQVCAHAAIWSAARYMHQQYHSPEFLPSQVNSLIGSHPAITRDYPSEGVGFDQMIHAFKKMGFSPLALAADPLTRMPRRDLFSSVYSYLESRLPVVLGTEDHALTVVGHTLCPEPSRVDDILDAAARATPPRRLVLFSDSWVDGLIVQDDAQGPYRILPQSNSDRVSLGADPAVRARLSHLPSFEESVAFMIAPLPYSVFLVDSHVRSLVENYLMQLVDHGQAPDEIAWSADPANRDPLVVRMYLARSVDYKQALREQLNEGDSISPELVETYELLSMPQYIWVCEVTRRSLFCHADQGERRILGEVLVDAKGHKFGGNRYIAVHLLDNLTVLDVDAGDYLVSPVSYLGPYRHHQRDH